MNTCIVNSRNSGTLLKFVHLRKRVLDNFSFVKKRGAKENYPNVFEQEHVEVAHEVSRQLALAVKQAHLLEQVQHHAVELETRVIELQITQAGEREQRELAETLREISNTLNTSLQLDSALLENGRGRQGAAPSGEVDGRSRISTGR